MNDDGRTIDEVFPRRVCINLDRRPERWRRVVERFARHGVGTPLRFAALDGERLGIPAHWSHTPGAYGCLRSHVEVVGGARAAGAPSVLIFEDDVVFDDELRERFRREIEQLPRDWDMLYFGALHKGEPSMVSDNLVRLTRSNSTYAYALRETVYDAFIELNSRAEDVLDNNSFLLQQRFNCYCFMPHLAWVEDDYSDAQRRVERHWYLRESLVLFGARVDELLTTTTLVLAHRSHEETDAATENLRFLLEYYDFFFSPHLAVVVVEQGERPTLDASLLPPRCEYVFLHGEDFDRVRCFQAGIQKSDSSRGLFILSDADIYLETLDLRGNLRMCARGDGATGFNELIELDEAASRELCRTKTTRGLDLTRGANDDARDACCLFLRRDLLGTTGEAPAKLAALLSPSSKARTRLFQSPNHALRLH